MNKTEQLAQRIDTVIAHLDSARDCFEHFSNYPTSFEQHARYSERGHQGVQESRQALRDICKELRDAR